MRIFFEGGDMVEEKRTIGVERIEPKVIVKVKVGQTELELDLAEAKQLLGQLLDAVEPHSADEPGDLLKALRDLADEIRRSQRPWYPYNPWPGRWIPMPSYPTYTWGTLDTSGTSDSTSLTVTGTSGSFSTFLKMRA